MFHCVFEIGNKGARFPAWQVRQDDACTVYLIDLRYLKSEATDNSEENMEFRADLLARDGVPEATIAGAATSNPPGFIEAAITR